MMDVVQSLFLPSRLRNHGQGHQCERRDILLLWMSQTEVHGTAAPFSERENSKRRKGNLSSQVALSCGQKEQLALAGFALPTLWQQKMREITGQKHLRTAQEQKMGQLPLQWKGTALTSVPLLLSHYDGSQVQGSLAIPSATLTLQLTGPRQSQYFPYFFFFFLQPHSPFWQ